MTQGVMRDNFFVGFNGFYYTRSDSVIDFAIGIEEIDGQFVVKVPISFPRGSNSHKAFTRLSFLIMFIRKWECFENTFMNYDNIKCE